MGRGVLASSAGPAAEEVDFGGMKGLGAVELLEWGSPLKEGGRSLLPMPEAVERSAAVFMV